MAYFGKSWRANRWDGTSLYPLGKIQEATPEVSPRTSVEVSTGTRQIDKEIAEVAISLDILMLLQRFDYIEDYAMISGEGSVPSHDIRWTDGQQARELSDAKVNTCEFRCPRGEAIKISLNLIGKDMPTITEPSWVSWAEKPVFWKNITTLTLGGTDLLPYFREIMFRVNNNIMSEYYGTGIKPQDVEEGEAAYEGSITLPRRIASKISDALAGTEPTFVVAIRDNQAVPVTKTFTFDNCSLGSRIEVRGLGLSLEAITLEPDRLTIS